MTAIAVAFALLTFAMSGLICTLVWRASQRRVQRVEYRLAESERLRQELLRQINELRLQLDAAGKVLAAAPARAAAARRREEAAAESLPPGPPPTWQDTLPAGALVDTTAFVSTLPIDL